MKKTLLTPLFALALGGCIETGNLLQTAPGVGEYYTLDSERLILCQGQSNQCHRLSVIVSERRFLTPMENAYGTRISGPNYPLQLARTLITPPGGEYEAEPIGDSGRYYRLPVNRQTDAAWQALSNAFDSIYNSQ